MSLSTFLTQQSENNPLTWGWYRFNSENGSTIRWKFIDLLFRIVSVGFKIICNETNM